MGWWRTVPANVELLGGGVAEDEKVVVSAEEGK